MRKANELEYGTASDDPPQAWAPAKIDLLSITESALRQTISGLAMAGPREMFCLWIGNSLPGSTHVSRAVVTTVAFPRIRSDYDRFEVLEGQLGLVTQWCAEQDLWVLAQVHSHPTDEPHSRADETWPASRRSGFLSVVFPFFAHHSSVRNPRWRLYESQGAGVWSEFNPEQRITVVPDVWLPQYSR